MVTTYTAVVRVQIVIITAQLTAQSVDKSSGLLFTLALSRHVVTVIHVLIDRVGSDAVTHYNAHSGRIHLSHQLVYKVVKNNLLLSGRGEAIPDTVLLSSTWQL